jgi:hypothetical protein
MLTNCSGDGVNRLHPHHLTYYQVHPSIMMSSTSTSRANTAIGGGGGGTATRPFKTVLVAQPRKRNKTSTSSVVDLTRSESHLNGNHSSSKQQQHNNNNNKNVLSEQALQELLERRWAHKVRMVPALAGGAHLLIPGKQASAAAGGGTPSAAFSLSTPTIALRVYYPSDWKALDKVSTATSATAPHSASAVSAKDKLQAAVEWKSLETFRQAYKCSIIFFVVPCPQQQHHLLSHPHSAFMEAQRLLKQTLSGTMRTDAGAENRNTNARIFMVPDLTSLLKSLVSIVEAATPSKRQLKEQFYQQEAARQGFVTAVDVESVRGSGSSSSSCAQHAKQALLDMFGNRIRSNSNSLMNMNMTTNDNVLPTMEDLQVLLGLSSSLHQIVVEAVVSASASASAGGGDGSNNPLDHIPIPESSKRALLRHLAAAGEGGGGGEQRHHPALPSVSDHSAQSRAVNVNANHVITTIPDRMRHLVQHTEHLAPPVLLLQTQQQPPSSTMLQQTQTQNNPMNADPGVHHAHAVVLGSDGHEHDPGYYTNPNAMHFTQAQTQMRHPEVQGQHVHVGRGGFPANGTAESLQHLSSSFVNHHQIMGQQGPQHVPGRMQPLGRTTTKDPTTATATTGAPFSFLPNTAGVPSSRRLSFPPGMANNEQMEQQVVLDLATATSMARSTSSNTFMPKRKLPFQGGMSSPGCTMPPPRIGFGVTNPRARPSAAVMVTGDHQHRDRRSTILAADSHLASFTNTAPCIAGQGQGVQLGNGIRPLSRMKTQQEKQHQASYSNRRQYQSHQYHAHHSNKSSTNYSNNASSHPHPQQHQNQHQSSSSNQSSSANFNSNGNTNTTSNSKNSNRHSSGAKNRSFGGPGFSNNRRF